VRFAETREARAVRELLTNGGESGRRPLGEKYVNRMVSANGAPTSLSMEEAKLLASLRKLDAHCLAIPAAAMSGGGGDVRAGSALGGYGHDSRTLDGLLDGVSTSGAYSARRSVEEAALLASLKRLDGRLGGMKDHAFTLGCGDYLPGPPPPALTQHPPAPQRPGRWTGTADAWGAPPSKDGGGGAAGRYAGAVVTGMNRRHERKQVGFTGHDGLGVGPMATGPGSGPGLAPGLGGAVTTAAAAAATASDGASPAGGGASLRSTVAAAGGGEVLRARQHVRDSGGTIRGDILGYF
jgi:hypothetical protein